MMRLCLFLSALLAGSGGALANCNPPGQTLFACAFMDTDARVEICSSGPTDEDPHAPELFTYNFTRGLAPAELYFETDTQLISNKYWRADNDAGLPQTHVAGFVRGNFVYAAVVTANDDGSPVVAQIHVYDSIEAFESIEGETDTTRLYCRPETIIADTPQFMPG